MKGIEKVSGVKNQNPKRFTLDFMLNRKIIVRIDMRNDCLKFFVSFLVIMKMVSRVMIIQIGDRYW
jgi:hypothetical protein